MARQRERFNVLLVMTDQHRADLMTCAGNDLVPTPHIDSLAARGVRFSQAYCPYPVCVASRMSLLTGLYAHTTGAIDNTDRLDWRYRTVAHHFAEQGYLTALLGKMHFRDGNHHGFAYTLTINDWLMYLGPKVQHYANEIANAPESDNFFQSVDDHGACFPDVTDLWDGASPWAGKVQRYTFETMASHLDASDHLDSLIAREAAKFLTRYCDQPFFLVVSFLKPHAPLYPPAEWAARYPIESIVLPPVSEEEIEQYPHHLQQRMRASRQLAPRRQRASNAGYLGNLAFVDTCVGQVLTALQELKLQDSTVVAYTSDHGHLLGEHGLRGKFCLFEPSVRVPLILSHPPQLPQGAVAPALTEIIGLYPTLSELAGLDAPQRTTIVDTPTAPEHLDAASFAAIARDPSLPGPPAAFSEYHLRSPVASFMIRTHQYKYIYNQGATDELYDEVEDPEERVNLIADPRYRQEQEALRRQLVAWYDPERNANVAVQRLSHGLPWRDS